MVLVDVGCERCLRLLDVLVSLYYVSLAPFNCSAVS